MSSFLRVREFLVAILCLSCIALFVPGETLSQEQQFQSHETNGLEPILEAEHEFLRQQQQSLQDIEERIPGLTQRFEARLQEFIAELNRLTRLQAFVEDNVKEVVLMRQFASRLAYDFQQSLLPLQNTLEALKKSHERLNARKQDILEQIRLTSAQDLTQPQKQRLEKFEALLQKKSSLQAKIQDSIDKSDNFAQRLQSFQDSLEQALGFAWKSYFLSPDSSIFSFHLDDLLQDAQNWRQGLPVYSNFFLIGQNPWVKLMAYTLTLGGLLFLIGFLLVKKVTAYVPDLGLKTQSGSLLILCLSLALWTATGLTPSAFSSVLLLTIVQILVFGSLSRLLWIYRLALKEIDRSSPNPLTPLWWLFTASLILQGLSLPASLLVLIWPIILLVFIFWLAKSCKQAPLYLELSFLIASLIVLIVLALLALLGWVHISLLLGSFLLVLALSLQFGATAARLLKSRAVLLPDTNLGYLGQGLIQGAGIPLLWILSFLLAAFWLGLKLGDVLFLKELTDLDLGWGAISVNIFRLILILIGFYLAKSGLVLLRSIIDSMAEGNEHLDAGTTATLKALLTYIIWSIFIIIALAFLGLNLTSLTLVAGGLSVGIGFGMQSIVNNFISGLILLFGRAIKPGDIIQVADLWAEVKEVNIRCTVVETFDKANLLIPNSKLIEEQIINWTLADNVIRRTITVGVVHGSDIELTKRLLQYIAETHPDVLKRPLPLVRFIDFGSSALMFRLYFFAMIANAWDTESAVRFEIDKIFREYGIQFAFPQQDLHIKTANGLDKLFAEKGTEQESPGVEKQGD